MSPDEKMSAVPLSRVVLYKHGIGYFERRGPVSGPARVPLQCRAHEIDDMLKSLVVLNLGGGRVSQVTYDCAKPLDVRLREFGFDLKDADGFVDLVAQLKGMPVTVNVSGESISGRVIGLDASEYVMNDSVVREQMFVLYTAEASFRRFSLSSISSIRVDDEKLAGEINQQLDLLFQGIKVKDNKVLTVGLEGDDERQVLIAYAIPCPIWKTSYRLVFAAEDNLILHGTAIVDNIQDEDWNEVEMVLVSASPISFIQPLYDPVFPERPTIDAQGVKSKGPVVAERATRKTIKHCRPETLFNKLGDISLARSGFEEQGFGAVAPAQAAPMAAAFEEAFSDGQLEPQAVGEEEGELFEYRIAGPVTVPRDSSALIPIVSESIEGERISLYNETRNSRFPYCAVYLRNTTGLTLEAGPVTVLEKDAYAGEGLIEVLKPEESRFLPYAIDEGCHVLVRADRRSTPIWRIRCLNGFLYMDYREQMGKLYHLENLAQKRKVVYVEHPVRSDLRLCGRSQPAETTQTYYRFRVELEAGQSHTLEVWEETDVARQIRLNDNNYFDIKQVEWLIGQNFLDRRFVDFLKQAVARREELADLAETKRQAEAQLAQYNADQGRARENLKTVGSTNERWRKAIDQTEDLIMETSKLVSDINKKIEKKWKDYASFVSQELMLEIEKEVEGLLPG